MNKFASEALTVTTKNIELEEEKEYSGTVFNYILSKISVISGKEL